MGQKAQAQPEGSGTISRPRRAALLMLAALSFLVGLGLAEGCLRVFPPAARLFQRELMWLRNADRPDAAGFVLDPEFGFRPRLEDGRTSRYGTRVNAYDLGKRSGVLRLLFVGDSVTERGRIVRAIQARHGDERFEYWNAGVGSFNVVQEVNYYKRFNAAIDPDHVILTFHNNDFETTPVAFFEGGRLVVYAPNRPLAEIQPWWFRHSSLYRAWCGRGWLLRGPADGIVAETEASLLELKFLLDQRGAQLTVLLLPVLAPQSEWRTRQLRSRQAALALLERHGFRYFDLLEPLAEALRDGLDVQEHRGDFWHPSDAVSARFAEFLFHEGLLAPRVVTALPRGGEPAEPALATAKRGQRPIQVQAAEVRP